MPLQLAGIQWEGKCYEELLGKTTLISLMSAAFVTRPSLRLVWFPVSNYYGAEQNSTTVPASAVGPDNLDGRIAFDDTVGSYDIDT